MIPLEKQVCNLELAKRLKELGVKQESLFSYFQHGLFGELCDLTHMKWNFPPSVPPRERKVETIASAFTVAELGEMLYKHDVVEISPNEFGTINFSHPSRTTKR